MSERIAVYRHEHPDHETVYDRQSLTDADRKYGWTETPLYERPAPASLSDPAGAVERERFRDALHYIRLSDWRWEGGGSPRRISNSAGAFASEVLGLGPLSLGEPSDDVLALMNQHRREALRTAEPASDQGELS